jgi:hypothetical protein
MSNTVRTVGQASVPQAGRQDLAPLRTGGAEFHRTREPLDGRGFDIGDDRIDLAHESLPAAPTLHHVCGRR